jgi:hypothetical protein
VNDFVVDLARDPATWVDDRNSGEVHSITHDVAILWLHVGLEDCGTIKGRWSRQAAKCCSESSTYCRSRLPGETFAVRRTCSCIHLMPKPHVSNALTSRCIDPRSRAIPWNLIWSLVAVGPRSAARQAAPTYLPGVMGGRTGTSKLTGSTGGFAAGAPF